MLNRITGWLLFTQAAYLASFILFGVTNAITQGAVFNAFKSVRSALNLDNTYVRMSDYIYYPMVFSSPINVLLLLAFFWMILRRICSPSFSQDFFCIINTIYIVSSGWILFIAFTNLIQK